ncbi:DUF6476 family protein [Falsiroseomonas sp. CW058]|uniref:DUF6476 family protein n=1 Tax=Falsiroseomonas sp. CW058 TaxID=3388664 RepID=UPI003D30F0AB
MPAASGGAVASAVSWGAGSGEVVRALTWIVVVMGVLIVAGTVTLVALLVQRSGGRGESPLALQHLGQPAGTRILSVGGAEGRIAVLVARPDGERVLLVDPARGRVVGELRASE